MLRLCILSLLLSTLPLAAIAQPLANPPGDQVVIQTTLGDITIELMNHSAPKTVDNFLRYVRTRYYIGQIFYRVQPDFIVQAGGFDARFAQRQTFKPIRNESQRSAKNTRGTVAMTGLRGPQSITSHFYFNLKDNPELNYQDGRLGAPVFAKVISGMDVVDKIGQQRTGRHKPPFTQAPNTPVVILDVRLEKPED